MTAWLSDWLKDIIAVILLAALVELLLPNKSMQRYARLVVGLFILITILTPILRLFQSDMQSKLDQGLAMWSADSAVSGVQMASLAEIRQNAEELSARREEEVARLTELRLEQAMQTELEGAGGLAIDKVDAELKWIMAKEGNQPYIHKVTVTLRETSVKKGVSGDDGEVAEVMPVDISVRVDNQGAEAHAEEEWSPAPEHTAAIVREALVQGWGVKAAQIMVRQPSPS